MNKRIKKKRALEMSVKNLMIVCDKLMTMVNFQRRQIHELAQVNSRNAKAINNRFDAVETYQQVLEDDVKELKKAKKKGLFGRK